MKIWTKWHWELLGCVFLIGSGEIMGRGEKAKKFVLCLFLWGGELANVIARMLNFEI